MSLATARIPALWQRYSATGAQRGPAPSKVFGVYTDYASDDRGLYTLLATIPPGQYLEFVSRGPLPGAVVAGGQRVWRFFEAPGAPRRAYETDYECYDPSAPDEVRIYVGIMREAMLLAWRHRAPIRLAAQVVVE